MGGGGAERSKAKRARKRNDREKKLELPNYRRQQPMPTSELEERASGRACQQPPSRASAPTTSFSRASVPTTSFSRASFARAARQKPPPLERACQRPPSLVLASLALRASVPTTSFSRARFARAACRQPPPLVLLSLAPRANNLLLSSSLRSHLLSCSPRSLFSTRFQPRRGQRQPRRGGRGQLPRPH